jgi:hypothetical protein
MCLRDTLPYSSLPTCVCIVRTERGSLTLRNCYIRQKWTCDHGKVAAVGLPPLALFLSPSQWVVMQCM